MASAQGALEQADSPIVVLEERAWVGGGQIAAGLCDIEKPEAASTLSERSSLVDSQAEMGHGTTGSSERVLASRGLLTSAEFWSSSPLMMYPMAGCFARCRLFWPKSF